MTWLTIELKSNIEHAEFLSECLFTIGAEAVTIEDAGDDAIFELAPGTTSLWQKNNITALFEPTHDPLAILHSLFLEGKFFEVVKIAMLTDENWQQSWRKYFEPKCFDNKLWVITTDTPQPYPLAPTVRIDPGLAFGTGAHPTTQLCLKWLACNIKGDENLIDYGCGSGILGIAAAKLGASKIWAIDHDPQALQSTYNNALANQVLTKNFTIFLPESMPLLKADLLIANILLRPLQQLYEKFSNLLKPGGQIILSGILAKQTEELLDSYKHGFKLEPVMIEDDWAMVVGTKKM